jgi:CheY-like chemotaxis protein
LPAGQYVMIAVHDSGTGMRPDVIARAFEPFFTTKQQGRGTGLGLSQVYGFARQSGGTVRIESRVGQGTVVRVYLPRTEAQIEPRPADDHQRMLPAGQETILVVDDDDDVRELVVGMLQELCYRVLAANNGAAALEILDRGNAVDLLLLDVAMPGMNGVELARAARQRQPTQRILFASGYTDIDTFGADLRREDLIKKPYRMAELSARVQHALKSDRAESDRTVSNVVDFRGR